MKGRVEATVITPVRVVQIKRHVGKRDTVVLEVGNQRHHLREGDTLDVEGGIKFESNQ